MFNRCYFCLVFKRIINSPYKSKNAGGKEPIGMLIVSVLEFIQQTCIKADNRQVGVRVTCMNKMGRVLGLTECNFLWRDTYDKEIH